MLSRALRQTATSSIAKRAFSTAPLEFSLPPLGFEFGALEPYISEEIMTIHYTKHHQTYINNLNVALKSYAEAEAKKDIAKMISLEGAIKFNGGGNVNHTLFWENLAPNGTGGGGEPSGELAKAIDNRVSFHVFTGPFECIVNRRYFFDLVGEL
mmetsp:Transcript_31177/g.50013  ORF Transcript_31177/g.50013 Transcript_31177/m.50013 type:complete len:154 (-) Transcript_31177:311-772(-)